MGLSPEDPQPRACGSTASHPAAAATSPSSEDNWEPGSIAAADDDRSHVVVPPTEPRQVLLFSGHRVDEPDRHLPRFTPSMLPAARRRLAEELADLQAGPLDVAYCQAAAGGDLLFLECCQALGIRCIVLLPFVEARFIEQSILASIDGQHWLDRWLVAKARLNEPPHEMPLELAPPSPGVDPYERCNRWLLNSALACGADKLRLLCLWDGLGGDGPGGVRHMVDEAQRRGGSLRWIDTRSL